MCACELIITNYVFDSSLYIMPVMACTDLGHLFAKCSSCCCYNGDLFERTCADIFKVINEYTKMTYIKNMDVFNVVSELNQRIGLHNMYDYIMGHTKR